MNTKDKINVVAKVLSVFNRIVFFLSIILLIASLILFMVFLANAENTIKSEIKLTGFATTLSGAGMIDLIMYFSVIILFFMKECFISNLYCRYFSIIEKAGTPFSREGAIEVRKIGIVTLILPFLFNIITATMVGFASDGLFDNSILMNYNPFPSFARGALLIYASAVSLNGYQTIKNKRASSL